MPDKRTVSELLADSEALARETLLDATLEQAPAMVRSWNQLVGSAVELWAVLPSAPNSPSWSDPMERLRAIGEAISRSVTAGHWPGQGPTGEHLTQIADNLSHAQHLVERSGRPSQSSTTDSPADLQHGAGQVMHTLYVAAHGTVVALGACAADLQAQAETAQRRRQPVAERPTALEITAAQGMIARFDAFEHLAAAAYLAAATPSSMNPGQAATPTKRLETALGCLGGSGTPHLGRQSRPGRSGSRGPRAGTDHQHHKHPDRSRRQKGHIDGDVIQRLAPSLEASQMAWNRMAKRWGELTSPASRTDPALVGAASEVRAAIAATATNQAGWATPDQLASRLDLPHIAKTLHLSMVAAVEIAYVVRDTAADHPGLTAPARIIGMRSQGEAEIAIEQGEARYEGVTWTTRGQLASNQLIPLPEPARRGLINLADDVIATTNQVVAAGAQLDPSDVTRSTRSGREGRIGRSVASHQITHPHDPAPGGPRR